MLKEIPQIDKGTNISGDYLNEYVIKITDFRYYRGEGRLDDFIKEFVRMPIKKYTERYPITNYNYNITHRVERLDELAEEANKLGNKDKFSVEEFRQIIREVYLLVTDKEPFFKL